MINVKHKTCEFYGCSKIPIFNIKGETKGRFCSEHKKPNMIDVKNKTCEFDGCLKQPSFNIKGETKGRFCSEHKKPDMIDVKHKTCEFDGCPTRVRYGFIENNHPDVQVINRLT